MAGEYFQPKGRRVKRQRRAPALTTNVRRQHLGSPMLPYALVRSNLHMYSGPGGLLSKRERIADSAGRRTRGGGGGIVVIYGGGIEEQSAFDIRFRLEKCSRRDWGGRGLHAVSDRVNGFKHARERGCLAGPPPRLVL